MSLSAFAPAKVNLFLHVGPPDPSGYHLLSSLAVFADVGDRLSLQPADAFGFEVTGPFAPDLAGEADNLVVRAVRALERASVRPFEPFRLTLDKRLPIASGVGGGSSDAGAALRLVRRALDLDLSDEALTKIAAALGADGPMCLSTTPALAEGRGDVLAPAPKLPELHAVLVNPRVPSPTGAVYRAYDLAVAPEGAAAPELPSQFETVGELVEVLKRTRNDLERPAISLGPTIGEALEALYAAPESLFVRMSGSGATCFALCESADSAASLTRRISEARPHWWAQACRFGGPWPDA